MILEDDILKRGSRGADKNLRKKSDEGYLPSISATRNKNYQERGSIRLELDYDKLMNDGYKFYPFDEVGNIISKKRLTTHSTHDRSGMFKDYKKPFNPLTGFKQPTHNINIKGDKKYHYNMEEEYEERCYKDIKNIGKYIMSIQIKRSYNFIEEEILKYLQKYPHIKILDDKENIIKLDRESIIQEII
jgi:hypothetical protein